MLKIKKTIFIACAAFTFAQLNVNAQEALKSAEEEYYDFLALQGLTERNYLNYRTLSDSEWQIKEDAEHPWQDNNLGTKKTVFQAETLSDGWFMRGVDQSVKYKVYGPEWFNSYNTHMPYGQNDGALWQGKGYNTSITAGARLEAYGFEVTFKPQISFSQNKSFDYIKPNYTSGKAATYGYYGVASIDAPQRFGDESFWTFDWGDTELRYTWHNFTAGFGTQSIWLGPAQLNPIIHSNNAPTYPKIDFGFRKTQIHMPYFGWNLGKFEFRGWYGKLTESEYFDDDSSNDNNLIAGFSFAWGVPGIFDGLSIGINRTMLSKWDDKSTYSLFKIYDFMNTSSGGKDENDQRFSFTFDYSLKGANADIYLDWGRNDYSPKSYILRYPFHTQGWTLGGRKTFTVSDSVKMELLIEVTSLECSADYDRLIPCYTTFYAHHIITQGYTNKGQWLGAGIGTGGNSQYLGFKLYYPKGSSNFFIQRVNPDLDYSMFLDKNDENAETSIRVLLSLGYEQDYFITQNLKLNGKVVYTRDENPLNDDKLETLRNNVNVALGVKYIF